MVHARYNEKEVTPNPSINFIACLPDEPARQDEARQLLRALAAQVKPVMKRHGFEVNSLEEYEYNTVFAGRNWNSGETIELVLRKPDGLFYPTYWLMSTLCHELAHIKHMNHGPAFQALWSRLRTEVRQLQARGYYGDGFWSSGTRLRDLAQIGGDGVECHDLPEYVCGGAQTRSRPTANRRRLHGRPRGKRREVVPSLHTGAQTGQKRKPGRRVTSKHAFGGDGIALSKSDDGTGMGFRKSAGSKRAREERALAAERRVLTLQGKSQEQSNSAGEETEGSATESDEEVEIIAETDTNRRQALRDSENSGGDLQKLCTKDWELFRDEFKSESTSGPANKAESSSKSTWSTVDDDVIEIFSSDNEKTDARCDIPQPSGSVFTTGNVHPSRSSTKGKGKEKASLIPSTSRAQKSHGRGKLVQTEINFRDKNPGSATTALVKKTERTREKPGTRTPSEKPSQGSLWHCFVCTLENDRGLVCSACGTSKGQQTWSGVLTGSNL